MGPFIAQRTIFWLACGLATAHAPLPLAHCQQIAGLFPLTYDNG